MIIDYTKFAAASVLIYCAEYIKNRAADPDAHETVADFQEAVDDAYTEMIALEESIEVMERSLFDELEERLRKLIID